MGWDWPYSALSETCHKEGPIRGRVGPPPTRHPPADLFSPLGLPWGRRGAGVWQRRLSHDERWRRAGSWRRLGWDWGRGGARSARLAQRPPGTGKGAGAKMFLIPASSCLARLHHSLLINSFLLPSSPTGRLLAPHRGCRTRTLPHAAPRPRGSHPLSRPQLRDHGLQPRSEPPTSASPRGPHGVRTRAVGARVTTGGTIWRGGRGVVGAPPVAGSS